MFIQILLNTFIVIALTLITQIGGLIYLLSLWVNRWWQKRFRFKLLSIFLALYLVVTFIIVPLVAPLFDRERVIHTDRIKPTNYLTVILNRNYVKPELNQLLRETEQHLSDTNIEIRYLDACFPFIRKFPLLPHLSHNDGKKIDISFVYENRQGEITNDKKAISGYGVFVPIKKREYNQTRECKKKNSYYDFPKYLTLGTINSELIFSEKGTTQLINALLKNKKLEKLFIEPNLKSRLYLTDSRVRNHGCRAVRHDDHIHIQVR